MGRLEVGRRLLPWLGVFGYVQRDSRDTSAGGGVRVTW